MVRNCIRDIYGDKREHVWNICDVRVAPAPGVIHSSPDRGIPAFMMSNQRVPEHSLSISIGHVEGNKQSIIPAIIPISGHYSHTMATIHYVPLRRCGTNSRRNSGN